MTYLTNPNFVDHIIKSQGAEALFGPAEVQSLGLLIEMETRLLLETAFKFMDKDRRDVIKLEDVAEAARENGHAQLILDLKPTGLNSRQNGRQEEKYHTAQDFMQEELALLSSLTISSPTLRGKWVYIKGKIPAINENVHLNSLTQMQSNKQSEQSSRKKFINVIKDDPFALLTKEQLQYFEKMCYAISLNINPEGTFTVDGDLNNLLPFFLKFLGETTLNQTGINFLLKLIDNKHVWMGVEYYLKKILSILLAYRGEYSFQVGVKIAQLVERFSDKYPILRDIYLNYKDDSYSTILKKVPFELHLGIPLEVSESVLAKCKQDSQDNDKMAILCMKALLSYSSELKMFKEYLVKKKNTYVYWHPCAQLKNDPYLRMF